MMPESSHFGNLGKRASRHRATTVFLAWPVTVAAHPGTTAVLGVNGRGARAGRVGRPLSPISRIMDGSLVEVDDMISRLARQRACGGAAV